MRNRIDLIEGKLDKSEFGRLMPEFFIVSFERHFRRWYYSRHAPPHYEHDLLEELRAHNRGDKLWLGLYRAIFLPDEYRPTPQSSANYRQATVELSKTLERFNLKIDGVDHLTREIPSQTTITHLARGAATWKEQDKVNKAFIATAKKFGVKS